MLNSLPIQARDNNLITVQKLSKLIPPFLQVDNNYSFYFVCFSTERQKASLEQSWLPVQEQSACMLHKLTVIYQKLSPIKIYSMLWDAGARSPFLHMIDSRKQIGR